MGCGRTPTARQGVVGRCTPSLTVGVRPESSHQLLDDACLLDSSQPLIEPLIPIGEALVVDAHEMQHRGVEVVDVDGVLDDVVAEVARLTIDGAALRAA